MAVCACEIVSVPVVIVLCVKGFDVHVCVTPLDVVVRHVVTNQYVCDTK